MTRKQKIFPAAAATMFAGLFLLIGWRDLHPSVFPDLDNYRTGFESGRYLFHLLDRTFIDFLLKEGVWVYLFYGLYALVGDIDTAFAIVSFVSTLLMALFVAVRTRQPIYLVIFLNPAFIELAIGQIRSSLAAGVFWASMLIGDRIIRYGVLLLAASIHTTFVLFAAFHVIFDLLHKTTFFDRILSHRFLALFLLISGALLVTAVRDEILVAIGDTRGFLVVNSTSGRFLALAWLTFAFSYVLGRPSEKVTFEGGFYTFCTAMALFSAIIGVYGARFSAIALPALAVMCADLPPRNRPFFVIQYLVFTCVYFMYWFAAKELPILHA